ncbi:MULTISPECIES: hypothetical protein [unclassified Exiguobacterium]|uniref:hypothetical protein n=1 Tax=unclassified Exiguobacterium TaxID=2644629 RepID=UPI001BEBF0E1|nr:MULTISPECIES: hypothetical protein [unclassified Exiguobacterium]
MKKYTSLALASTLAVSTLLPLNAGAEQTKYSSSIQSTQEIPTSKLKENENRESTQLDTVKKHVFVDSNGHIGFKNVPTQFYENYELAKLQKHFDELNSQVDAQQIVINEDLSISEIGFQTLAVYGKWTNHWWGYDRKFTKKQAVAYKDQIDTAVIGLGAGAVVTSPWLVVGGGFALTAGWYTLLGKRIEVNNRGKNGILVEIYWARTFDITPL